MIYPPSIWRQLHEAKTSIEGVAVHKHHEFPTGAVNAEVLSCIVGISVPKDALKDGVPLWQNTVIRYAVHLQAFYSPQCQAPLDS